MSIGENIRRLREAHGMTQRELGAIAGVSDKAVSTWERGTKAPRMAAVKRLAEHFGVPNSALLDEPLPASGLAASLERLCTAWDRTPEHLERELSIPRARLAQLRRGQVMPTEAELDELVRYFHTPREVLMGRTLPAEAANVVPLPSDRALLSLRDEGSVLPLIRRRRVPVLGRVPAGIPIEAISEVVEEIELDSSLAADGYDYFGLLVTGDSMYPEYRDGDVVVLRVQATAETGDDVVAYIGGGDATLKRLTRTESGIQLRPLNPTYPVRSFSRQEVLSLPVTIAGVVVEQRRRRRR